MTTISGKRVLVFDWDGTLFDSMAIKSQNFAQILVAELDSDMQEVRARYMRYSGIPRREIFLRIAADFARQLSEARLAWLSEALTRLNCERLAEAKLFPDAIRFLERMQGLDLPLYISSSVPEAELQLIVTQHLPEKLRHAFRKTMGTTPHYAKGRGHLSVILQEEAVKPKDCLVFGDDIADVELSAEAGVQCIRICREATPAKGEVTSFDEVITC